MTSEDRKTLKKQRSDVVESVMESLNALDMWAVGITIVIGGQYFGWNGGLTAGVGSCFISFCLTSIGYICLVHCIAELSSGLPFAGGNYGLTRVTSGIFPGYLVGCYDALATITYVATSTFALGAMFTELTGASPSLEPLYWFLFYSTAMAIQCYGGLLFWRFNLLLALISLFLLLIYILGSAKWANFPVYAVGESNGQWFEGGLHEFMRQLYLSSWFYVGVENITIACQDVKNPKHNIPIGYISCVWTLFFTGLATFFVCVSLPPASSGLSESISPLQMGYHLMFRISMKLSILFSLPALYATAFGFMLFYGRQLRAMGNAGLINPIIGQSLDHYKTPFYALLFGSIIGYIICVFCYFYKPLSGLLFQLSMLSGTFIYLSQFMSYLVFKTLLANIKRDYTSPLGIAGAFVGCVIFLLVMISIMFFQKDHYSLIAFVVFTILSSIYYFLYVKDRQFFSEQEKTVLMAAHVVKFNTQKNTRSRRKKQPSNPVLAWVKRRVRPEGSVSNYSNNSGILDSRHAVASNISIGDQTVPSTQTANANEAVPDSNLQYNRGPLPHHSKFPVVPTKDPIGPAEEPVEEELVIEPEKMYSLDESEDKDKESGASNFANALPDNFPVLDAVKIASWYLSHQGEKESPPDCEIEDV